MNWSNTTVLVTGAGGFIGSHLTETLASAGAKVRAFVRYNSKGDLGYLNQLPANIAKNVEVVSGDIRDPAAIFRSMQGCDTVFHLGALIAIPYSYRHPFEVAETNVMGTVNVLEAARNCKVRRLVHTSTSEVYGTARTVPISEEHPLQGQSPYSASKIGADKMVESYYRAFDVPAVTVRPFNTYGPRQSTRAVIPTIITQALKASVIKLGNLTATRDFTFVSDTVNGFLCAAAAGDNVHGEEVNLGVGSEIEIGALAQKIISLVGREVEITCEDVRKRPNKSEVERLLSDNRKALALLKWKPMVGLDEGLQKTIAWVKDNLAQYRVGEYHV